MKPGDLLLWLGTTWHGAGANHTDKPKDHFEKSDEAECKKININFH